jgi:hypothetical protein
MRQTFISFNDSHPAAKAAHGLGQLQSDVTASQNQEMLRNVIQFESFDMGQRTRFAKTGIVSMAARVPVLIMTFFPWRTRVPPPESATSIVLGSNETSRRP